MGACPPSNAPFCAVSLSLTLHPGQRSADTALESTLSGAALFGRRPPPLRWLEETRLRDDHPPRDTTEASADAQPAGRAAVDAAPRTEERAAVKHFVLDTNVLLHNPDALFVFKENNVVVPFAV
ncbi:MAG: hypothetical protein D6824_06505, partial [Planctomycetota bacterium]